MIYAFRRRADGKPARVLSELPTSTGPHMVVDLEGEGPQMVTSLAFVRDFVAAEDYRPPKKGGTP